MYTKNSEALDYIYNLLTTQKVALGLQSVWYADDEWAAPYPAAVCASGGLLRVPHSTQTFRVQLNITIFIMHANLATDHRTRTREDLQIAEAVSNLLHTDKSLGGNILTGTGIIVSETPGVTNRPKGQNVISTSLVWNGESRQQFV
jgi:hypothetical protein